MWLIRVRVTSKFSVFVKGVKSSAIEAEQESEQIVLGRSAIVLVGKEEPVSVSWYEAREISR